MNLEPIIGLEIHVQLKTKSKLFCSCANDPEKTKPNVNICPICTGQPGTLPVVNQQAVDYAVLAALALNCKIAEYSKFDRKNYFYPDLPKGYQISQYDKPIGQAGHLVISLNDKLKRIGITRIHLEEDAAKLIHLAGQNDTLVDFNRCGTPLVEIVTDPQIDTPAEAKEFLQELKLIMQYLAISDADMEKGQLRCDVNVSLRPINDQKKYPKTEIKNVNSFRAVEQAIAFEISRQTTLWQKGEEPKEQSTRRWNEVKGITEEQRTKEEAQDYRYFPEPDLPPLRFSKKYVKKLKIDLPELPEEKRGRFHRQFGLTYPQALLISASKRMADFFEETVTELIEWLESKENKEIKTKEAVKALARLSFNWITTELFRLLNESKRKPEELRITPENMAEFITMVYRQEMNSSAAQEVLRAMFEKGSDPSQVVKERNLTQLSDSETIEKIVLKVLVKNREAVQNFQKGKQNALQFLIGQVMKETKGKVNPKIAAELLVKKLKVEGGK